MEKKKKRGNNIHHSKYPFSYFKRYNNFPTTCMSFNFFQKCTSCLFLVGKIIKYPICRIFNISVPVQIQLLEISYKSFLKITETALAGPEVVKIYIFTLSFKIPTTACSYPECPIKELLHI